MKAAVWLGIGLLMVARSSQAHPPIYRCESAGGVVFTDRPCGSGASPHEVDDSRVTVYTPAPLVERAPAPTASKQAKAKRAGPGRAADPAVHQAKCARLEQGLRDLRAKMRGGYGAREGERLKARQRQLNEQRRTQKCG
ncbi:MAG: hypothetical protein SXG53_10245 [Pseudomonadota bacterium]|nr:hypothetical protein [Pseudomonadota bacterium]